MTAKKKAPKKKAAAKDFPFTKKTEEDRKKGGKK